MKFQATWFEASLRHVRPVSGKKSKPSPSCLLLRESNQDSSVLGSKCATADPTPSPGLMVEAVTQFKTF